MRTDLLKLNIIAAAAAAFIVVVGFNSVTFVITNDDFRTKAGTNLQIPYESGIEMVMVIVCKMCSNLHNVCKLMQHT